MPTRCAFCNKWTPRLVGRICGKGSEVDTTYCNKEDKICDVCSESFDWGEYRCKEHRK